MENLWLTLQGPHAPKLVEYIKVKEIGLDLPMATRLRDKMVANGINLPDGIVTAKQLENALLALRDKGDKGDEQDV